MKVEDILQTTAVVVATVASTLVGTLNGMPVREASPQINMTTDATVNLNTQLLVSSGMLFVAAGIVSLVGACTGAIGAYMACRKPAPPPPPPPVFFTHNPLYIDQ